MLYDGDCAFCLRWIRKWQRITGDRISYLPYQKALTAYPEVTEEQCRKSVQLILHDGAVMQGARAVFQSFAAAGQYGWLLWSYQHVPLFGWIAEGSYRLVARNRVFFSKFS